MGFSVNFVHLTGRLGQDPEFRDVGRDMKGAKLNLATSESKKTADGKWEDETHWHRVDVVGFQTKALEELRKGDIVTVVGKLITRSYEDRNGDKKYITEVEVFRPGTSVVPFSAPRGNSSSRDDRGARRDDRRDDRGRDDRRDSRGRDDRRSGWDDGGRGSADGGRGGASNGGGQQYDSRLDDKIPF